MQHKTIFITGGATGIGAATARLFNAKGWRVAIADINDGSAAALASELKGCIALHADTREHAQVEKAVAAAVETFGGLGAVFANAGIHRRNRLLDVSDEEFDLVVKTNIYGTVNTLRAAVPSIIASGGGAVVINASDQVFVGKPGNFAYGLTKGALGQLTRTAALELAPQHVRVNAVCPATVHTPLVDNLFDRASAASGIAAADLWAEEDALFPRGAAGTPEEIAQMVYFLADDTLSSFCTGGRYLVDGGLTAG